MSDSPIGFANLRASLRATETGFTAEISDAWRQGRTAYGGVTTGLAIASARRAMPDLPPLRSMLVNFTGPVVENPVFVPVCLRQGKSVTTVQVTVESAGKVAAQIIFTFGGNRDSSLLVPGVSEPLERSPLDYEPFTPKEFEPFVPKFVTNFDTRLVAGSRSVSGADQGYVRVVTRHLDVESRTGIDSFVALADVLPPAALCMAKTIAPVSSVTWMMNMLTDQPKTEDGWWQAEARLTTAANGYSSQQMKIWALDGTPVAEGMQSVALFF
jgi:acyl-CoA thioesterase